MSKQPTFAQLLRQRRKELGWTQAKLSAHTGYALISIKKFEQGTRHPPYEQTCRLAELLGWPAGSPEFMTLLTAARGRALPLCDAPTKEVHTELGGDAAAMPREH